MIEAGSKSKLVGIHYEPLRQFSMRLVRFEEILRYNEVKSVRLSSSAPDFWDVAAELQLLIYYWGHWDVSRQNAKAVLPTIENELNIPCFPNQRTWWSFDDKIRQYYLMRSHGFPMAKSWIFWELQEALSWADTAPLPVVFKLSGGAGSRNVVLINEKKQLIDTIKQMFNKGVESGAVPGAGKLRKTVWGRLKSRVATNKRQLMGQPVSHGNLLGNWVPHKHYALFQEFLPGNTHDTRVTTIGDRAFAFRRFNREGDFRASGSGVIDWSPSEIDQRFVEMALSISDKMGFQTMTYDFLFGPGDEFRFCEISYGYNDECVFKCPGYWDKEMVWHEGHNWPQYLILKDLLGIPEFKQPNLDLS